MGNSAPKCILDAELIEELKMKTAFSEQQILRLFEIFLSLDDDSDGLLSVAELARWEFLASNPFSPRILEVFDPEGDRLLNFQGFASCLSVFAPDSPIDKKTRFLFSLYDYDNDGMVSANDLTDVMQRCLGNYLTAAEIKLVVEKAIAENSNIDRQGRITYEEFIKGIDLDEVMLRYTVMF
jgi:Ca2+-binding EF-hand superfamily protein